VLAGFVTFEGIDGAGKTTVSRLVTESLQAKGHVVFLTSEPTKTWLGDAVRRAYDDDVGGIAESFLFLADRAAHVGEIRSHLERGELVLCDRYADSTYAYQGARLKGLVADPIRFLQRASEGWTLEPDLTVLLRVSPNLGLKRIEGRPIRIRFEDLPFLRKVAANYDRLARSRRFVVLDGARTAEVVARDAAAAIENRLRPRRKRGAGASL
jgi:dTMP kinase